MVAYFCRLWLLDTKSILRIGEYITWLEMKIQDISDAKILEWERFIHFNVKYYEPYKLENPNKFDKNSNKFEDKQKLEYWRRTYFQSYSFFKSHLFTVVWLYMFSIMIALYDLFFYSHNPLTDDEKIFFIVILILNTVVLAFPFLDLLNDLKRTRGNARDADR